MLGPSPYFILSGGNQPSSHLVLLDHRRRTRDYVMFVQRPDLSKTAPLSRTTSERRHAGRMQLLGAPVRSEEHTSELQSLMRISYAVFCLKKKKKMHTDTIERRSTE